MAKGGRGNSLIVKHFRIILKMSFVESSPQYSVPYRVPENDTWVPSGYLWGSWSPLCNEANGMQ